MHRVCALGLALVALLAGCAKSRAVQTVAKDIDLSQGIAVAILPFDQAPGVSDDEVSPGQLVRQGLVANFRLKSNVEVVELAYVDDVCRRNGWTAASLARVPATEVGRAVGADSLLFGTVTDWSRNYYGLESAANVGAKVKLVDARTGAVLWEADRLESKHSGLSGGPTGYASAAFSPLQGLAKSNLFLLANELSANLVDMLLTPTAAEQSAGATAAKLEIGSAAYALSGEGALRTGDTVTVVALGTAGQTATFDVGGSRRRVPMTETAPGQYVGAYLVHTGDQFQDASVVVTLTSRRGFRIRHLVTGTPLSTTTTP